MTTCLLFSSLRRAVCSECPVGSVKAGVMICRVEECPTAMVAVICFRIPSNLYSDRHA